MVDKTKPRVDATTDHPVATAFLAELSRYVVSISVRDAYCDTPPAPVGTGCIVARVESSSAPARVVIATAGHVVAHDQSQQNEWTIARETSSKHIKTAVCISGPDSGATAIVDWYAGDWYQSPSDCELKASLDLGSIDFPIDSAGTGFMGDDHRVPMMVQEQVVLTAGTRVGWAGYSTHAHRLLGRPTLMYHEGVISAAIFEEGAAPLYLIDGYNDRGLSGSPVWYWNENAGRAQIAAVITHYSKREALFPGLVHASPINFLLARFRQRAGGRVRHP